MSEPKFLIGERVYVSGGVEDEAEVTGCIKVEKVGKEESVYTFFYSLVDKDEHDFYIEEPYIYKIVWRAQ